MKKLIGLLIVLTLIISAGSISFAAEETTVPDPQVPAAPVQNVDVETYDEPQTFIADNDIPAGPSDTSAESVDIQEEIVPQASALPKTGGIPAEAFYAAGALLIVAALILSRKKAKADTKN